MMLSLKALWIQTRSLANATLRSRSAMKHGPHRRRYCLPLPADPLAHSSSSCFSQSPHVKRFFVLVLCNPGMTLHKQSGSASHCISFGNSVAILLQEETQSMANKVGSPLSQAEKDTRPTEPATRSPCATGARSRRLAGLIFSSSVDLLP